MAFTFFSEKKIETKSSSTFENFIHLSIVVCFRSFLRFAKIWSITDSGSPKKPGTKPYAFLISFAFFTRTSKMSISKVSFKINVLIYTISLG